MANAKKLSFVVVSLGGAAVVAALAILCFPFIDLRDIFLGPREVISISAAGGRIWLARQLTTDFYTIYLVVEKNNGKMSVFVLDPDCAKWSSNNCKMQIIGQNTLQIDGMNAGKWLFDIESCVLTSNGRILHELAPYTQGYRSCARSFASK